MVNKISRIYARLLRAYGKQHWWPVTGANPELEICVGAILTQNTNWKNVEKAIANLRKAKLIDAKKLVDVKEKKLALLIRSSGYYNQKAKKLKEFARFVIEHGGLKKLFAKPELRELLLSVKGIGPETADSMILYAANKPVFVIDAYTRRIFSRLGPCSRNLTYHELQDLFHSKLKKDVKLFNEYHALIVMHGKDICKTKPQCEKCVLKKQCPKLSLQ